MVKTHGEDSSRYTSTTVMKWVADFKRGRESNDDDARTGRPSSTTTDAQVEGIHHMVMNDRLSETLDISVGSVHTVLIEILEMSKLSARWVPRMLN